MELATELKYDFNSEKFDSFSDEKGVNYVVCSTPRSGSTLLVKGLSSTGMAGIPHEYFNVDHKSDYLKRWKFKTKHEYVNLLIKNRVSDNGVFGFKIHFNQYSSEFETEDLSNYFKDLKYILITRDDKIAQGISLEIASQTNNWSSEFNANNDAKFKFNEIKKRINDINDQEASWFDYFKNKGIHFFVVHYEELEKNYEATISKTLKILDLDSQLPIPHMQIKKQRNWKNYIWKKRYQLINLFRS